MKVFAQIELPININDAFDRIIADMRDENPGVLGLSAKIIKEVGDLGPGTIIESTYVDYNISFPSQIIENLRPHSFVHRTSTNSYENTVAITLERNGEGTILKSCSTIMYKNVFRNFFIFYYAPAMMNSRHYLDTHRWGYLFPDRIIKAKYSATVLGLPRLLIASPFFIALLLLLGKIYELLNESSVGSC
jgi:hypothetical protein